MSEVSVTFTGEEVAVLLAVEAAKKLRMSGNYYGVVLDTYTQPTKEGGLIKIVVTLKTQEDRAE